MSFSINNAFLYSMKYLYIVSQSVIIRIELYFIFISDFFDFFSSCVRNNIFVLIVSVFYLISDVYAF